MRCLLSVVITLLGVAMATSARLDAGKDATSDLLQLLEELKQEIDTSLLSRRNNGHKPTSCSEEKSLRPDANDGEYTLYPFSTDRDVALRVYCHDMASLKPKEFLTLPSGPDENYAIFFGDRLVDASLWQCTGPFQDQWDKHGTTKFSKLRIQFDTSKVEVIGDDYTFAQTTGPNDVAYGQAGDCYSAKRGCAKGTFKVDLTGTGLALAPEVHWVMARYWPNYLNINDMLVSEDRKVASGRCGGWCGRCWPEGRKIYLTPSQVLDCPPGYTRHIRHCYKAYGLKNSFSDAEKTCEDYGGTLAMPRDIRTQEFLRNLRNQVDTTAWFWLGFHDQFQEGDWVYMDGTSLGNYQPWYPGEPNSLDHNENCGMMFEEAKGGRWNDVDCSREQMFICQTSSGGST
ncbi:uncharacterized protein LOC118414203 [Branchiostoma floridae]|uniref:Uncharacterized protein LOC118414203 n=1 Tax=Branchiostoma floridae TaxID=7739 RepID=A0A9J7L261_BRAFL|nr:uncharacterized protein LOC118414203 [Branchiostoma floridae]XP_035673973.1 uncharacterized protein LOC118414203 [Branchiostoma floridae]